MRERQEMRWLSEKSVVAGRVWGEGSNSAAVCSFRYITVIRQLTSVCCLPRSTPALCTTNLIVLYFRK